MANVMSLDLSLSVAEGQQLAPLTVDILKGIRGYDQFDLFWTKVASKAGAINVGEPTQDRRRKPKDFPETGTDFHRQVVL